MNGFEICRNEAVWGVRADGSEAPCRSLPFNERGVKIWLGLQSVLLLEIDMVSDLIPTEVYDSYWRFAAERQAIYYRRLARGRGPWTEDQILQTYRFTNVYRAADKVSQYLIREVQYRSDRAQSPDEVFFRTMLFKIFNKIETWEYIENFCGNVTWQGISLDSVAVELDKALSLGKRLYSAAYIMPSPNFGHKRKHANHLALLKKMMQEGVPQKLNASKSLQYSYKTMLSFPGLGPFLAFQYAIDLNYSTLTDFSESDFVVAGPGALDGIAKCFENASNRDPKDIIYEMVDRQEAEFSRLNLSFQGLFGRRLQPIDCQNLFCEISKYARVAHPRIPGISGRSRIKQLYRNSPITVEQPYFPPKWNLKIFVPDAHGNVGDVSQGAFF